MLIGEIEGDGWITAHPVLARSTPQRHSPARYVADGCAVLRVTHRNSTIAATVSPDLPDPEDAARIVADALNAHLP